jgi:hypothetical protein
MHIAIRLLRKPVFVLAVLVTMVMTLTACEETVDPILDSDRQLTLWGTLDMNADVQFLRVIPIREVLDVRFAETPELEVISIDLDNGETVVWQDSVISFLGSNPGLLFYTPLRVVPTHTYRIEVRSPDLEFVTSAVTTIPMIPEVEIFEERVTRSISNQGFFVSGLQDVKWSGINRMPHKIEHWYRFLEFGSAGFTDFLLPYVPPDIRLNEERAELDMTLNLVRHRDSIQKYIRIPAVRLVGMGQTITVLDEDFRPPGGEFEIELLAQPGTLSNVEHGFGFVGSVGRFSTEWMISDSSAALMTYTPLSGFRMNKTAEWGRKQAEVLGHPWIEPPDRQIPEGPTERITSPIDRIR